MDKIITKNRNWYMSDMQNEELRAVEISFFFSLALSASTVWLVAMAWPVLLVAL